MALVLIRGSGDVGSAVAHALFAGNHGVVIHDYPLPSHPRRSMSFTDALYRGKAELDGVFAKHARTVLDLAAMVQCGRAIPMIDLPLEHALAALHPGVLVDARMRKHSPPDPQRGLAPLTVGLGPNFEAGRTIDVVVETAWGDHLGDVITSGRTSELAGEPLAIDGHTRGRFVYAPIAGKFSTHLDIGSIVAACELVGWIEDTPLYAPLSGGLRGLAHDGASVEVNAKIAEVDPRGAEAILRGLGERPRKIADAVLKIVAKANPEPGATDPQRRRP